MYLVLLKMLPLSVMEYCDNTNDVLQLLSLMLNKVIERTLPGSDSKALFPAVLISSLAALQI